MFARYISVKNTDKFKLNISVCYNFMSDYVEFSIQLLTYSCSCTLLRSRHNNHLVRAGTSSWFHIKDLFWLPRSQMGMVEVPMKASFHSLRKGWKYPQVTLEIPAGVTQTAVGSLAAVLVIMTPPLTPSPADVLKIMIYHVWYKSRPWMFP